MLEFYSLFSCPLLSGDGNDCAGFPRAGMKLLQMCGSRVVKDDVVKLQKRREHWTAFKKSFLGEKAVDFPELLRNRGNVPSLPNTPPNTKYTRISKTAHKATIRRASWVNELNPLSPRFPKPLPLEGGVFDALEGKSKKRLSQP